MTYVLMAALPAAALIALIVAIRKEFHKQVFFFSAAVTMAVCLLTMEYLTFYGFVCAIIVPLTVIYIITYLIMSRLERRKC